MTREKLSVTDEGATENRESVLKTALRGHVMPGLDALRTSAVLMVVLKHLGAPLSGSLGVIIFFVLSGFLITSLLLKEFQKTGTISFREFYRRRAYRILPTFYFAWLLTFVVRHLRHEAIVWQQAATVFFYLTNYGRAILPISGQITYFMSIAWSLAIEEQFYVVWPLALLWILLKPKHAVKIIFGVIVAIWVWRVVLMFGMGVGWEYVYNATDTRADAIMIGSALAIILRRDAIPRFVTGVLASKWLVLIPIAVLAWGTYYDLHVYDRQSLRLAAFTIEPVFTAMILVQWLYWGSLGWKFLEYPAIKFIARLSYGIYLYQDFGFAITGHIPIPHMQRALTVPIVFGFAAISYYCIERPFMQMRDRGKSRSVLMDDGLKHSA